MTCCNTHTPFNLSISRKHHQIDERTKLFLEFFFFLEISNTFSQWLNLNMYSIVVFSLIHLPQLNCIRSNNHLYV